MAVVKVMKELVHVGLPPGGPTDCQIYVVKHLPTEDERHPYKVPYPLGESPIEAEPSHFRSRYSQFAVQVLEHCGFTKIRMATYADKFFAGADPNEEQLADYRPVLENDIKACQPTVVLAMGKEALQWFVPGAQVFSWYNRPFPYQIGDHKFWVIAAIHPEKFLFDKHATGQTEFTRTIHKAWKVFKSGIEPKVTSIAEVDSSIEYLWSAAEIAALDTAGRDVAFDIETPVLDPLSGKPLLTASLSYRKDGVLQTYAIPLGHPESVISASLEGYKEALQFLFDRLRVAKRRIAQNAIFEMRWMNAVGMDAYAMTWQDTMVQAYVLDTRKTLHSLDIIAQMMLGITNFKGMSDIDVANLSNEPIGKVLLYNGRDSAVTLLAFEKQERLLENQGLTQAYDLHIKRLASTANMGDLGVTLDQNKAEALHLQAEKDEVSSRMAISSNKDVVQFYPQGKNTTLNPASPLQIKNFFIHLGKLKQGDSTDEESLSSVRHPVAKAIIEYRSAHRRIKLFESYKEYGGKAHPQFLHTFTATGRYSCRDPNIQNLQKGEAREMVKAPPGYVFIGADFGQLEFCIIAAVSGDRYSIRAIRDGFDVHFVCAQELIELHPPLMGKRKFDEIPPEEFGKFRSLVKNVWVFPAFYQANVLSLADYVGLPKSKAQEYYDFFWKRFAGVRRWQMNITGTYNSTGMVKGPTGRTYRGMLTLNDIANYPIQGGASDIVVEAQNRCFAAGLPPSFNVHDELMFLVKHDEVEEKFNLMTRLLLEKPEGFDWLNVPLSITAKVGKTWGGMKEVGKFTSTWGFEDGHQR